ncbi:HicB-like protein involved in pilus formation [Paraburkholderia sp. BL23I1N1]|uniref:toxin-antitoxin system HicB family antitoxin n=1 Tax=Paraburkholderia sp. BL23I1N1 TaxID=1938802 RepID=UPI000E771505|nr:toxin-antitoxin system HicB family antitoxin [Paraburkholderia sp. BL23I1N1]RKE36625.1 HicB-like protein involved in pilus formation [Paraburkholderia sp. BL23I1N1]
MPKDQEPIKTSLRIPPLLHAELERAAQAAGLTLNAEMLIRLRRDPTANDAAAILSEIEMRDQVIVESLRRQLGALWGVLDRTDGVIERVVEAMTQVAPGSDAADLKRELQFMRELIGTARAHR